MTEAERFQKDIDSWLLETWLFQYPNPQTSLQQTHYWRKGNIVLVSPVYPEAEVFCEPAAKSHLPAIGSTLCVKR